MAFFFFFFFFFFVEGEAHASRDDAYPSLRNFGSSPNPVIFHDNKRHSRFALETLFRGLIKILPVYEKRMSLTMDLNVALSSRIASTASKLFTIR